jgi:hypothetical protein
LCFVVAAELNQDFDGIELDRPDLPAWRGWLRPAWRGLLQAGRRRASAAASSRRLLSDGRQRKAVEEGADLTFGQGAGEFIDQLALEKHLDRRNAADAEVLGDFGIFVGVDHGEQEAAGIFLGQLFQHRLQDLAGLAPRRPEVDDDWHILRGHDDLGFKLFKGNVKGELGHGEGSVGIVRFGRILLPAVAWRGIADAAPGWRAAASQHGERGGKVRGVGQRMPLIIHRSLCGGWPAYFQGACCSGRASEHWRIRPSCRGERRAPGRNGLHPASCWPA